MRISDWSSDVCSSDLPCDAEWQASPQLWTNVAPVENRVARLPHFRGSARDQLHGAARGRFAQKIGRASRGERVCQYVWIPVVAASLKKNNRANTHGTTIHQPRRYDYKQIHNNK